MLYAWNDFDPLLFQIPLEIIRHDHVQRVTMVLWIVQFCQDVFHGVIIEFIRHVPKKVASADEGLIGAPFVHHTIGIIVKDLLTWRASNDS